MDDLEFRRRAYAEPGCQDKDFVEFKNRSVENSNFVEELKRLDENLQQAMQVKPPQDLLERIKLRQTLEQHKSWRKNWKHWSLVASLFVTISVISIHVAEVDYSHDGATAQNLSDKILYHIHNELNHLDERQNKSLAQVNSLLSEFGGKLNQHIARVNYLGSCTIANKKGVHMIVQGDIGPVTVMFMPEVPVVKQQLISGQRFEGLIMSSGKGSVVIVGEKKESIQSLKSRLVDFIHWI